MLVKTAKKLLEKYDLYFGYKIIVGLLVKILDKNQNYNWTYSEDEVGEWDEKIHNEKELKELIKEKGIDTIWFAKKEWCLGNILGDINPGETLNISILKNKHYVDKN
jgi:hypothetical protein